MHLHCWLWSFCHRVWHTTLATHPLKPVLWWSSALVGRHTAGSGLLLAGAFSGCYKLLAGLVWFDLVALYSRLYIVFVIGSHTDSWDLLLVSAFSGCYKTLAGFVWFSLVAPYIANGSHTARWSLLLGCLHLQAVENLWLVRFVQAKCVNWWLDSMDWLIMVAFGYSSNC